MPINSAIIKGTPLKNTFAVSIQHFEICVFYNGPYVRKCYNAGEQGGVFNLYYLLACQVFFVH